MTIRNGLQISAALILPLMAACEQPAPAQEEAVTRDSSGVRIIDNAVAAVDGDGVIELEVKYAPSLKMVTLELRDNGSGIPDEDKPKLFEPYFSTKKAGTGLGLAIVSAIISDHNGYIRVRDNQPTGTKFIIDLPLST